MNADNFLNNIISSQDYRNQIVHLEHIRERDAIYRNINPALPPPLKDALEFHGIKRLFSHQAEAIDFVRNGKNIVVVTNTASGKTLCYNVPIIETLISNTRANALYIYPTKALAQDQLGKLKQLDIDAVKAATFDGDTPRKERGFIKLTANIVLTNPDMLHMGILPYHASWGKFFRGLKYVVIDEVHMYRGVFGAHVANVIRRLRRIAHHYGSDPQFLCASATINNPAELVKQLTGVDAEVIDNNGAPTGEKLFAFWNPPYLAAKEERRSANAEAVNLFTKLVKSGVRTLAFTKSRKMTELVLRYARTELAGDEKDLASKVMAYRAGYTPADRRKIEKMLFDGKLLGVASTTALEVGVDIGGLDAVLLTGYPGTIASAWQQAGRAGRGLEQSLAILVALDDPLDQFIMNNPEYFFKSNHERAIVDNQNPYILADHLNCAAYELPIEIEEACELFGEKSLPVLSELTDLRVLNFQKRWYWNGGNHPAGDVNIRSASGGSYDIVSIDDGAALMGTVDSANAFFTIHPGAVYLHAGESYVVTKLDLQEKTAYVERSDVTYYTTPADITTIMVQQEIECQDICGVPVHFGDVSVTTTVSFYFKKRLFTDMVIEKIALDLPETTLSTQGLWIELPPELTAKMMGRGFDLGGTIHAIEHVSIGIMPIYAQCDRNDIGGVSHSSHPDVNFKAAIFIYDGHQGGVGLSKAAYDSIEQLLEASLVTMMNCKCDEGCPSCVQSPKCGNNNTPLDKKGAIFLLQEMFKRTNM